MIASARTASRRWRARLLHAVAPVPAKGSFTRPRNVCHLTRFVRHFGTTDLITALRQERQIVQS